jgi:uncharacterized protein (TIGR03437 family)
MRGARFLFFLMTAAAAAQTARLTVPIDESRRLGLPGTIHPRTRTAVDLGPVEPSLRIAPIVLLLKRSPEQQAALEKMLEEQRDPISPDFHKWLTPEQYAERFGLVDDDISTLRTWIQSHGLAIDHAARGRNWIGFSGTAQQVESALGTQIHRYRSGTEEHFANSTEVSIPAALAPVVGAFIGLDDFRPMPQYTSANNTTHYLAPDDLAIIYDIMPVYKKGIDGTGQRIAIVGQTDLEPDSADIRAFRNKFNLPGGDPQVILYGPDPGLNSSVNEADLDLEWSAAIARNASIIFVTSADVDISSVYAVDQNLAPVISRSYGVCEQEKFYLADLFQSVIQQANAQGITYIASSGDAGPSNCAGWFNAPIASEGLSANFPASIPEITAVGGTEFDEGSGNYWNTMNTGNEASAISYIPEKAWNDSVAAGTIQATGGGPSIFYAKPPWQTGPGVPADNVRDTPDVAMPASAFHDGYWACTGGGCSAGFGGTSFAAPVFAGIVALLNQSVASKGAQSPPGLGNINPDLYRIANATKNVFHDITVGGNIVPCAIGTPNCTTGSFGYSAGPGYDMATGLGSVDVANLVNSWNISGTQTTVAVKANHTSISMSGNVQLTITVTPVSGSAIPAGTVYVNLSNTTTPVSTLPSEISLGTASLASGSAQLEIYGGQLNAGANTITVTYDGDAEFNGSSATVKVNVSTPTTNSAVVLTAFPAYYAYQDPPIPQTPPIEGFQWRIALQIQDVSGVGTTITHFSVDGLDDSAHITELFGTNILPPHGILQGVHSMNVPSVPVTVPVIFSGQDSGGFQWTTGLQVPLVGGPEQFTRIFNGGLANAASFASTFAPGMIMSVFGGNLNNPPQATAQAQSVPLPLTLAGSSATINGVPAPYYYASDGQVNIQIPYETAPGDAVLTITGFIGQTFNYAFRVQPSAPGIFFDLRNGAPVPSETGSPGLEVVLYITGDGLLTPALATGASPAPGTPLDQLPKPKLPVTVYVANLPAQIAFIGITPGIVGATQINYIIPSKAPLGVQPVVVTVGGVPSPPVFITLQ